jgi:diguanylate cyclase
MPRPVVVLVGTMAGTASLCIVTSGLLAVTGRHPEWWQLALCVGLLAAGALTWFTARVGSHRIDFGWAEAALAVALALLPAAWVVPAVAVGATIAFLRQRRQPVKMIFNVATQTVGAALAVGVVLALTTPPIDPASPRDVVAIVLAAIAFSIWTDVVTAAVVGLSQAVSIWRIYRSALSAKILGAAGNVVATVVVLMLVRIDIRVLVVVPALLLCLRQAYEGRMRGHEERQSWQGLLEATRTLSDLDEDVVLARGVSAGVRLFSADAAEVQLTTGRLVRGDDRGITYDGPPDRAPALAVDSVVERPLGAEASSIGVLRLCFLNEVVLSDREQAMLAAVAAELHSALVNARQHATARFEATHDPLTGLLNRAGLLEEGRAPLAEAAGHGVDAAVVLVDLSGFREILDTVGHAAGEAVLRHTAHRLSAAAMPGELVARLDSDDFIVLLPRLTDPVQAHHRADALLGALATPTEISGATLSVSGVAGIAYAVRGLMDLDELMRQAGVAVHAVRGSGGRIDFYAPERDAGSVSRLVMASELRAALRGVDEMELLYQPIIDLHSGEAISAEALVRWNHPVRGQLLPDEFLPVVEHAGLLPDLTRRVLDLALTDASEWARHGIFVPVAINVSPRTLLDREFPGQVAAALSRHRMPAGRVTLEIIETSVLSHLQVVDQVLDELRDLGVRLSLDGFGTGWSSLSHLARVPVREVKLAAAFTEALLSSPQAEAVVRGTLEIARALDLRVVAEGVTNAIQRAALLSLGCHAGQGMFFFPPLNAQRISAALWSSAVRAVQGPEGADIIPLSQRRPGARGRD